MTLDKTINNCLRNNNEKKEEFIKKIIRDYQNCGLLSDITDELKEIFPMKESFDKVVKFIYKLAINAYFNSFEFLHSKYYKEVLENAKKDTLNTLEEHIFDEEDPGKLFVVTSYGDIFEFMEFNDCQSFIGENSYEVIDAIVRNLKNY